MEETWIETKLPEEIEKKAEAIAPHGKDKELKQKALASYQDMQITP